MRLYLNICMIMAVLAPLITSQLFAQSLSITLPNTPIQPNSTFNVTVNLNGTLAGKDYTVTVTCSSCSNSSQVYSRLNTCNGCNYINTLSFSVGDVNTEGMAFDASAPADNSNGCPCTASTVLPVELSSFTAELKDDVKLNWQTATELNNSKFIIETSTQGEVFQRIGEIAGAGTTTEPQNYTFTHHTPNAGVNYYRLKQVDVDGTFEYSKVIAINAPGSAAIFAFPNPARDKITLQYDQSKGAGNIQLFDALGRRVNASIGGYAGNYEVKLPEGLSKGTYWLKVERAGKVQTVPVVKE